jgi:hypothetical protein
MNEKKIKTGTFKYINHLQTGEVCLIKMTVDDVEYAVPLTEENTDYAIIKKLADEGTISIEEADA